jgi:hypothetical protein
LNLDERLSLYGTVVIRPRFSRNFGCRRDADGHIRQDLGLEDALGAEKWNAGSMEHRLNGQHPKRNDLAPTRQSAR